MADGCNLYVTEEDIRQLTESLDGPRLIDELSPADMKGSQVREMLATVSTHKIVRILEGRSKPAARAMGRLLMSATSAQENLNPEDARRIPDAFRDVLKDHPRALGVFVGVVGSRSRGSSGILHGAEILAAQALQRGQFTTSTGDQLTIDPQDRLDFGLKLVGEFFERKRGGSIETDLLIDRGGNLFPIGIDVKYSQKGQYPVMPELPARLKRVRNALGDGQLDRFVFVTQGKFTDKFKEAIDEANRELVIDWMNEKGEEVQYERYKTSAERDPVPNLDPRAIDDFDGDEILDLAGRYGIRVIETCEHVRVSG